MSDEGTKRPGRVLLIEDEPNIATAIAFILQRDGWRVSTHSDGTTALDAVARHAPDVVVLDVMLPGKSGFDVLAGIRQGARPDLPVLMLTAKGQQKDRERAAALGASRFMTKPFANRDLLDAIRLLAAEAAAKGGPSGESDGAVPFDPHNAPPADANGPDQDRAERNRGIAADGGGGAGPGGDATRPDPAEEG